ncbi:hypothetical protein HID58_001032 [Brassica napus]|uniref:HSF-type DNA-binding domain-containing protein n=1 Tax=Brassica napus TaxID=3708 RepID=A0ABQ8EL65_BRANA|nr:hypothetical protein HID58_001032 [Brassica napus]
MALSGRTIPVGFSVGCTLGNLLAVPVKREKGLEAIAGMKQFHVAIYEIVDDPSLDSTISWSKNNKSFVIWNPNELFTKKILKRFFCCNLSQFLTELDTYGFVRIKGSEHLEFGHKQYFVRGKPELLKKMRLEAAMNRMKKSAQRAKARAEAEKNGSVTVRREPRIIINADEARMRYKQIFESSSSSTIAKTPLENRFRHLRI